jgi:signal transduction histidine kinase
MQSTLVAQPNNESIVHALQVAVDRNNNLNLFMRNFAEVVRLPSPDKKTFDLHKMIHDVCMLMQLKADEKEVVFYFEMAEEPFLVLADPQQMEQVLINIVKNAIEAIDKDGMIRLVTDKKRNALHIIDNGKGIGQENVEELFSPFFSTKKDGQGIGLTLIKDILHHHGFDFSLKTDPPGATTFSIYF